MWLPSAERPAGNWAQLGVETAGPHFLRWSQGSPSTEAEAASPPCSLGLELAQHHSLCRGKQVTGQGTTKAVYTSRLGSLGPQCYRLLQSMSPNLQHPLPLLSMETANPTQAPSWSPPSISTLLWVEVLSSTSGHSGVLRPHLDLTNPVLPGDSRCGQTEPLEWLCSSLPVVSLF